MENKPLIKYETEGGEIRERYEVLDLDVDTPVGTRFECLFASDRLRAVGVVTGVTQGVDGQQSRVLAGITIIEEGQDDLFIHEFEDVQIVRLQAKKNFWGWLRTDSQQDDERIMDIGSGAIHPEGIWVIKQPADVSAVNIETAANMSIFANQIPDLNNMTKVEELNTGNPAMSVGLKFFCLTGQASVQGVITEVLDDEFHTDWSGRPMAKAVVRVDFNGDARRLPSVIEQEVQFRWLQEGYGIGAQALIPLDDREWPAVMYGIVRKGHLWIQAASTDAKIEEVT